MKKPSIIVVTCDGGGTHNTRVETIAAFKKTTYGSKGWQDITYDRIQEHRELYPDDLPELDALRHAEKVRQEIVNGAEIPWQDDIWAHYEHRHEGTRPRYRLECLLCLNRGHPNTLVLAGSYAQQRDLFDGLSQAGQRVVTIDLLRQAQNYLLR